MDNFSENIVKEIEARGAVPKPRWHFLLKRSVFWIFAIVSVGIGAVAFAAGQYIFFDNDGASFAQFRDTPIQDIFMGIPYIWLAVLGLFIASAYFGFRHTRKGYRYATVGVVVAAILASIVIGFLLNEFDVGVNVHKYLLRNTTLYDPLIHSSEDNDTEGVF